jgi:hypothetical protein
MSELVKLYNPANASTLTPEQVQGLQDLTSSEIKELAIAYPNATMQRAYLLIIDKDKPVNKQLPALSSFENLWNLRERSGLKSYVAFQFKGNYKPLNVQPSKNRKVEVVDLSNEELLVLPGFKKPAIPEEKNGDMEVKVKKINRKVKEK